MSTPFLTALAQEMNASATNHYQDNHDRQFGPEPASGDIIVWRECAGEFKRGLQARQLKLAPLMRLLSYYLVPSHYPALAREKYRDVSFLYAHLSNAVSRSLLVKLIAYRILGFRKVKLPRNTADHWREIENMQRYVTAAAPIPIAFMNAQLAQYDLSPLGYDVRTYASAVGGACAFVQKQYEYHANDVHCKAVAGDVAIDAGACWGETTLYFAHEVGANGKVIAFEFIPSNLAVLRQNLAVNPTLAERVTVVERPLWEHSDEALYYVDRGPGSRVFGNPLKKHDGTTRTITIDAMVEQQELTRVDFIKMDIEGAEFPALKGAERTIRAHRPKLAISIYHQISDFINIPKWLHGLDLRYDLYLEHHTIHTHETVLFAVPRAN